MLLAADGSPVEAALTGVNAAGTDTESVAVDAAAHGPVDGADTDETKPRRRRRRGGARRRRGADDGAAESVPADSAPDAAAS